MSTIKKGQLTAPKEWAKHLRPEGRREFWGTERAAERNTIRRELEDQTEDKTAAPPSATKRRKRFGLEYRLKEERLGTGWAWGRPRRWRRCWKWYATAEQRDQAMAVLNSRKGEAFEYRPVER